MSLAEDMTVDSIDMDERWLSVVGMGDDGWSGLGAGARELIKNADLIVGGARHIGMLPNVDAVTRVWSGDFAQAVRDLDRERGCSVVALASGDPLLYGVGVLVARTFKRKDVRIIPHVSTFAHVCARLVWPQLEVQQVSLCGRPVERLRGSLGHGQRIIVLSADGRTPAEVCAYLRTHGFGGSTVHVLEHLGGQDEAHHEIIASDVGRDARFSDLNALAIECCADDGSVDLPTVPGLADDVFENDGQMTKREVRAITLARLAPRPGQLLWDIGLGAGSVAIEWLRSGYGMRAVGIERNGERAHRAEKNAERLGVDGLKIVTGDAKDVISELERPDAIFIGGGLTSDDIVSACWDALLPDGRLVANTVTLESEAVLLEAFRSLGGDLTRIGLDRADPVGAMTGWRPAMTVTQWVVIKPRASESSHG